MAPEWTTAMTDAVASRLGALIGESPQIGQQWIDDGAHVKGMTRDAYAQWLHGEMRKPTWQDEHETHCQDVLAYARQRREQHA